MEKEKLSSELKTMVGENSLSDRTWNDYIENTVMPFLPTEQEKVSDYLTKHANSLKSLNGQLNFDVAGKVNDFKKNYKPDSPTPQAQTPTQQKEPTGVDSEITQQLQELAQFKSAYEKEQLAKAQKAKLDALLEDAKALAKEQGASDDIVMDLVIPTVSLKDTDSKEAVAIAIKKAYDSTYSKLHGGGYNPAGFSSNGGGANSFKAYKERKQKEGKLPK